MIVFTQDSWQGFLLLSVRGGDSLWAKNCIRPLWSSLILLLWWSPSLHFLKSSNWKKPSNGLEGSFQIQNILREPFSTPRMPAVSFYAHYITENGKDKFLTIPFSVFFYLLFYLEMNESTSLYRFPCNSAAFEPSACCLWFLPAEWSWYLLSHIPHVPRSFAYAQDDNARRESSTGSRQR
jgi:hypothetical protein